MPGRVQKRIGIPLTQPQMMIMLSLFGSPKHGYAVIKDIRAYNIEKCRVSVSTFYRLIQRFQKEGIVVIVEDDTDDPRRIVYKLTLFGEKLLKTDASRMLLIVSVIQQKGVLG